MTHYCPQCNKPAFYYNEFEAESYCEYCDQDFPTSDFYPDEEEYLASLHWDAIDDRISDSLSR